MFWQWVYIAYLFAVMPIVFIGGAYEPMANASTETVTVGVAVYCALGIFIRYKTDQETGNFGGLMYLMLGGFGLLSLYLGFVL